MDGHLHYLEWDGASAPGSICMNVIVGLGPAKTGGDRDKTKRQNIDIVYMYVFKKIRDLNP